MKSHVENLIQFELSKNIITKRDVIYIKNQLYSLLNLEHTDETLIHLEINNPAEALEPILDILENNKVLNGSQTDRDLFDSKVMNVFAKLPSVIQNEFDELSKKNNKQATKHLYDYMTHLNYIRKDRVDKNIGFKQDSKYGFLEITINLSKPEKDPKSIALAGKQKSTAYPKCVLCKENEGFSGNYQRDSRHQHRLISFDLLDEEWFFQYSPYIYYNEHTIVFSAQHKPMRINRETFERLLSLTDTFEGYFFGSNADLPIVGGSILSHEHYQGGKHIFPIEKATVLFEENIENLKVQILNWPLSTIRVISRDKEQAIAYANKIFEHWKTYNDKELNIKSHTNDIPHHTITPIARKNDGLYELDLILRDNQTSDTHPMGIFHPHSDKWHIKKENIGLIEAIGLAILPGRLKTELEEVKAYLINNEVLTKESLKHQTWADSFKEEVNKDNIDEIIEKKLALKFEEILEDCGVFKLNTKGIKGFKAFLKEVIK